MIDIVPLYHEFSAGDYEQYEVEPFKNGYSPLIYSISDRSGDIDVDVILTPNPGKNRTDIDDPASVTIFYYGPEVVDYWISDPMLLSDALALFRGITKLVDNSRDSLTMKTLEAIADDNDFKRIVNDD